MDRQFIEPNEREFIEKKSKSSVFYGNSNGKTVRETSEFKIMAGESRECRGRSTSLGNNFKFKEITE